MKKIIILLLMLTMITGVFAGCKGNAPETTTAPETTGADSEIQPPPSVGAAQGVRIGIAMPTKDSAEWNRTGDLMKNELSSLGYAVTLDYASNDIATQETQIENMLNSGCQCLIIAPVDSDSLGTVLNMAKEQNVPVISYDKLIMNSDAVSYYVSFESYIAGTIQGEYIRDKLNLDVTDGPYNIELITGDPGDSNAREMFSGAMDVLNRYIDEGKLVVKSGQTDFKEVATAECASEAAQSRMDAIISANYSDGTMLHAVLCSYDSCARGAARALEGNYEGTWPIITGSGCEMENVKNILNDKQSMSVFRDSRTLASKAVEMADAIFKDEDVPVNEPDRFSNNAVTVPAFLCAPVEVDKDNYLEILVESGYYSEDELR